MASQPTLHCLGALALELSADGPAGLLQLERDVADGLSEALGDDLCRLLPGVETLDAGIACALFDPAELLRPRWPVHSALAELLASAPGRGGGRMMTLGADAQRMPVEALQPDARLAGGLMRLLPLALVGDADRVKTIGQRMEATLLDTGMASAQLALDCQAAFGVKLEHARWMTLHDLCAMTAMQYDHAGLADAWRLIEAALLAPQSEEWLREDGEPLALYRDGRVRIAQLSDAAQDTNPQQRRHDVMRARQLRAVLAAHGVESELVEVSAMRDAEAALRPSLQ